MIHDPDRIPEHLRETREPMPAPNWPTLLIFGWVVGWLIFGAVALFRALG